MPRNIEQLKRQLSRGAILTAGATALLGFNAAPAQARSARMQRHMDLIHRAERRLDRKIALEEIVTGDVKHDVITTSVTKVRRTQVPIEARADGKERLFRLFVDNTVIRAAILPEARSKLVPAKLKEAPVFDPNPHNGGTQGLEPIADGRGRIQLGPDNQPHLYIPFDGSEYQKLPAGKTTLVADIGTPKTEVR